MPTLTVQVNTSSLAEFQQTQADVPKILLFTTNMVPPNVYNALAFHYRLRLVFGQVCSVFAPFPVLTLVLEIGSASCAYARIAYASLIRAGDVDVFFFVQANNDTGADLITKYKVKKYPQLIVLPFEGRKKWKRCVCMLTPATLLLGPGSMPTCTLDMTRSISQ